MLNASEFPRGVLLDLNGHFVFKFNKKEKEFAGKKSL